MPESMNIAVNGFIFRSNLDSSYYSKEEKSWSQGNLESTSQDDANEEMLIFSESDPQFDLLKTAVGRWTIMVLSLTITEELIILKELVELLKLFSSVEEDLDDLVDGEQEYAEAEDDVGVELDEFVNSVLMSIILATVGAVPCNPPSGEHWVGAIVYV